MNDDQDDEFESLLATHTMISTLAKTPSPFLRFENAVKFSALGEKRLFQFLSQFGKVLYINFNPHSDNVVFVFFSSIPESQRCLDTLSKNPPPSPNAAHPPLYPNPLLSLAFFKTKVVFENFQKSPATFSAPILNSSRHLWIGSIDEQRVDSEILERIFSPFGKLTDRPYIYRGESQGFVDFTHVYEAVDALKMMNGALLGTMNLVIRFGRQEIAKTLSLEGLPPSTSLELLRKIFAAFGPVEKICFMKFPPPENLIDHPHYVDQWRLVIKYEMDSGAQRALDKLQGQRIFGYGVRLDYDRHGEAQGQGEVMEVSLGVRARKRMMGGRGGNGVAAAILEVMSGVKRGEKRKREDGSEYEVDENGNEFNIQPQVNGANNNNNNNIIACNGNNGNNEGRIEEGIQAMEVEEKQEKKEEEEKKKEEERKEEERKEEKKEEKKEEEVLEEDCEEEEDEDREVEEERAVVEIGRVGNKRKEMEVGGGQGMKLRKVEGGEPRRSGVGGGGGGERVVEIFGKVYVVSGGQK
eukprot:TRINITY_DN6440_c0_g1_i1.p1 TRINITY_DN6440_c0_g1~~TRINITY_DN6440_c0_g1_i1.p1  ORF type:complete len:524 (+),score=212.26 TRINITY_DN6440_c0_g1_i1:301-1872(+)